MSEKLLSVRSVFFVIVPICLFLNSACLNLRKTAVVKRVTLDTVHVTSPQSVFENIRGAEPIQWNLIHTDLALRFDLENRSAEGSALLTLVPYFYPTDSLKLDAKGMKITGVQVVADGGEVEAQYTQSGQQIFICLDSVFYRTDTLKLHINYVATPYAGEAGGGSAILSERGLYFVNPSGACLEKPTQIWTQGETESNSHWMPTIDQPNERMTMRLALTFPDSMISLSNGLQESSADNGDGTRTEIWITRMPIQVYAYMFAIGNFSVVEGDDWNAVRIRYYIEPKYAPFAGAMFRHTMEMMEFFSAITGVPYPWAKYSQVVVRDYVSGAMENTGASLFGEFMNQNLREIADRNYEDVVSHELFHQWFGNYVTAESWSQITVNESFANYGELLWREFKYGKTAANELLRENKAAYLQQTRKNDPPLVRYTYQNRNDVFDRVSYEKGGTILRYLHGLSGDSAFFYAMNLYLTENALSSAEATHWRLSLEKITGLDWKWFFDQWYFRGGHPEVMVRYRRDSSQDLLTVEIEQKPSDGGGSYYLPLKARLLYPDTSFVVDWVLDRRKQDFSFSYRSGNPPVFIPDCNHWLPGRILEEKTVSEWTIQYQKASGYLNRRKALAALFHQPESVSDELLRQVLNDRESYLQAFALKKMYEGTVRPVLLSTVITLADQGSTSQIRALALQVLGKWKMEQSIIEKAIRDSSYVVSGAALLALFRVDSAAAYQQSLWLSKEDPRAELRGAIGEIFAKVVEPETFLFFKKNACRVAGRQKITLLSQISKFSLQTGDGNVFREGLELMKEIIEGESIEIYRDLMQGILDRTLDYYQERDHQRTKSTLFLQKKNIVKAFRAKYYGK